VRLQARIGTLLFTLAVAASAARGADAPAPVIRTAKATFAGGCFWCMQPAFDGLTGVISTTVGYTGGTTKNPSYQEVGSGTTGHAESIEVEYDPQKVSYEALLEVFWHNVDPTDSGGQFCDRGTPYRSAIFYHDGEQKRLAEESKAEVAKELRVSGPIVTEIVPASTFYRAEEYHQSYSQKNPLRYRFYRRGCGRDGRIAEVWGRPGTHGSASTE
jgi:peptide-methionine (S)-S-oxide reductase